MLGAASQTSRRQHSSIINPQTQGEEHVQVHFCGCCHSRSSTQTSLILSALTSVPLVLPPGLAVSIRKVVSDMTIVHTCKSHLSLSWNGLIIKSSQGLEKAFPHNLEQSTSQEVTTSKHLHQQLVIGLKVKTVG